MVTYAKKRRRNGNFPPKYECGGEAFAALDLGTNNCRLLVARRTPGGFKVVDSFSRIVSLGEGLSTSGVLSEVAMIRTISALRVCVGKLKRNHVQRLRCVATAACRQAENCDEFVDLVREELGIYLEIIAGSEEARLALAGCIPLFDCSLSKILGFDIGGGSTELIWQEMLADKIVTLGCISLPVGVMTLTERHGSGAKTISEYAAMVEEINAQLIPFCAENEIDSAIARGEVQMIGTSGTVTTLAAIDLDLKRYDRALVDGAYINFAVVRRLSDHLRSIEPVERANYPCIGVDRCELMIAGCAILEAICARMPVGLLRVADRGIREGILHEFRESMSVIDEGASVGAR